METAIGHVCSVDGGKITVVVESPVACRRCASGKGCGAGLLAGPGNSRRIDVIAPIGMKPVVGDAVTLTLAPSIVLRAAAIAYGLPLVSLVASAWLAWLVGAGPDSLLAIGIVAAGLTIGVAGSRHIMNRDATCKQFVPVIDRRADPGE